MKKNITNWWRITAIIFIILFIITLSFVGYYYEAYKQVAMCYVNGWESCIW